MSMTDDLAAFFAARLDEDEMAAKHATEGVWRDVVSDVRSTPEPYHGGNVATADTMSTAAHVARHDPARVLREVAAKRAILGFYVEASQPTRELRRSIFRPALTEVLSAAVRVHVAVYSDHPDYRQEWQL